MKTCTKCKTEKPLSSFGKNNKSKDKLHYYCKDCTNRKQKLCQRCGRHLDLSEFGAHSSSKDGLSPYCRGCHVSNRDHYQEYKSQALGRGISFSLSQPEFYRLWQKPCVYCGEEIATIKIDRVRNREGYQAGNVVPCCTRCNYSKSVYSVDEWLQHMLNVLIFQGVVVKTEKGFVHA